MNVSLMILGVFFLLGAGASFHNAWYMADQYQAEGVKVIPSGVMALLTLTLAYLAFRSFGGTL